MPGLEKSRLDIGIDVPWVTSWSTEDIKAVGPCATVGGQLAVLQGEHAQYGRPIYSRNHFRRQRDSVRRMLCPMCGAPTWAGNRWSQTGKLMPAGVMRARGLENSVPAAVADKRVVLDAGSVAPGHLACMTRSLEQCPHLRGLEDRELKPFPERWQVTPMMLTAMATPSDKAIAQVAQPILAIGFLQLCGITNQVDKTWRAQL